MGIRDIYKLLSKYMSQYEVTRSTKAFRGKRVAIDGHQVLLSRAKSKGDIDSAVSVFLKYVKLFTDVNCEVICVFDGDRRSPEKAHERSTRRRQWKTDERTVSDIASSVASVMDVLAMTFDLEGREFETALMRIVGGNDRHGERMTAVMDLVYRDSPAKHRYVTTNLKMFDRTIEQLALLVRRRRKITERLVYLDPSVIDELMSALQRAGVTCIKGDGEADFVIGNLAKHGHIDAVLSADSDMLAHRAPVLIRKIEYRSGVCRCVVLDDVLSDLDITYNTFVDLCVMLGTDYNPRTVQMNYVNIWSVVKRFKTLEDAMASLDYPVTRQQLQARDIFKRLGTDYLKTEMRRAPITRVSKISRPGMVKTSVLSQINRSLLQSGRRVYLPR